MMFDPGTPETLPQLQQALNRLVTEGIAFLAPMSDAVFFALQGTAWSPASHVRHLQKSSDPLVTGLKMPALVLRLRYGSHSGGSRRFAAMVELYRDALAKGATAGRFTPSPEPPPANPADRRSEIINGWTGVTVELVNAAGTWSDNSIDSQQLPHPVLGPLTIREMLMFTVYHTAHHLRRVEERLPAGA